VLTALVGSGLPAHRFDYLGFLPRKRDARLAAIGGLAELPATLIIFEAPHRLLDTLADLREVLGDRPAALARNLTKAGEEFLRGTLASVAADLADRGAVRGEYTVLVAGAPDRTTAGSEELADRLAAALARAGMTGHAAREVIMEVTGLPRNQVYGRVQAAREQAARSQAGQA
jgi:16S rRNA (cytidine1402-2'-O)-methyltransferase